MVALYRHLSSRHGVWRVTIRVAGESCVGSCYGRQELLIAVVHYDRHLEVAMTPTECKGVLLTTKAVVIGAF